MKNTFIVLFLSVLNFNLASAAETKITHKNILNYSLSGLINCTEADWNRPDGLIGGSGFGFETKITLKSGENLVARTCMGGPGGYRSARTATIKDLSRIMNNETSFEKNTSTIVCFKTIGIMDSDSKVIVFDHHLVKCL